uniref:Uncharacterized protein n=1 Tax=Meloidogyne enterolobii TaxID=390850 RepID=A0A6V7YDH2_MELEN|nr:unnamed protein product [Meloidogyne enterolobii]
MDELGSDIFCLGGGGGSFWGSTGGYTGELGGLLGDLVLGIGEDRGLIKWV